MRNGGVKFGSECKPSSITFVGDRGFGVGSSIKDHLKYGGKWKQETRSKYTNTVITNVNMTPHTCLYRYSKLDHPVHVTTIEGKKIHRTSKEPFI